MAGELTLHLTDADARELSALCAAVGFPPEAAAIYAIRLVSACVREGLFSDIPPRAWPKEAQPERLNDTGTGGKVISFPSCICDEE